MSFNILSLISEEPILIKGNKSILTSFPDFFKTMKELGAISLIYGKKIVRPIITIDGPAASGKGTVTKRVANDLIYFM